MGKMELGQVVPDFLVATLRASNIKLHQLLKSKETILIFLRFMGCRFTQYDIDNLLQQYNQISSKNAQAIVIVQSSVETVQGYYESSLLPFEIICDPNGDLYRSFSVLPADSELEMKSGGFNVKVELLEGSRFIRGKDEGNPLQLPATFVLSNEFVVEYSYYGKNAADVLSVSELVMILDKINISR